MFCNRCRRFCSTMHETLLVLSLRSKFFWIPCVFAKAKSMNEDYYKILFSFLFCGRKNWMNKKKNIYIYIWSIKKMQFPTWRGLICLNFFLFLRMNFVARLWAIEFPFLRPWENLTLWKYHAIILASRIKLKAERSH